MPCLNCRRRVENTKGEYVRYCVCGCCNFCHIGYVGKKTAIVDYEHWYLKKEPHCGMPKRKDPLQSHGGHRCIPLLKR